MEKKKNGRPTKYTQELSEKICSLMSEGKSLKSICENGEDMPDMSNVFRWLSKYPMFRQNYTQAQNDRTEAQLEELNELANEAIETSKTTGDKRANAVVSAYKLKADNMKWVMSKMKPKKYGDKLALGGDTDAPLTITVIDYHKKK